jgi:hypothetical protein
VAVVASDILAVAQTSDETSATPSGSAATAASTPVAQAQKEICAQYSRLSGLASHTDARVRRELLSSIERLAVTTEGLVVTETAGLMATLNSLVVLSLDEVPAIQAGAAKMLDALIASPSMTKSSSSPSPVVVSMSAEANRQLFELSQNLGQCLGLYEASRLEDILLLLTGYLRLLARLEAVTGGVSSGGTTTTTFFLSRVHIRTLVQNLIRVSELSAESSSVMALPMPSSGTGGSRQFEDFNSVEFLFSPQLYLSVGGRPAKTFRYLYGRPRLAALVADAAALLGATRLYTIAEYLMEGIRSLGKYRYGLHLPIQMVSTCPTLSDIYGSGTSTR